MLSPEMMKMVQAQMANMTPAEIANMQRMAMNMDPAVQEAQARAMGIDPAVMRANMRKMKDMSEDDLVRQMETVKSMSPKQLERQMKAQSAQAEQEQSHLLRASEQLKAEGNRLVAAGKHSEASEKYRRAMSNVADAASAGAKALKVSCQLNLSLCLLKTGQPEAAAAEASAVIAQDKQSLKGYFRRGQARLGAGQHAAAVRDLRKAASLAPGDATVEASLREAEAAAEAAGVATGRLDDEEEEEEEAPVPAPPAAAQQTLWNGAALGTAAGAGPAGFPGPGFPAGFPSLGGGAVDPRQLDAVREMLRSDPTAMQRMAESVGNLSPEQLEAMSAAMPAGMPKITPQIAEQMQGMMKNMSPEALDTMVSMAAKIQAAAAANPGEGGAPNMAAVASEVMKTITPEQLATMSEAAGMKLSGDQAAALTAQMQKVSPETMAKLIAVGTFVSRAVARARDARDWAKRNPGAVAAGVLLLAAWWLRRRLGRAAAQPTLRAPVAAQPVPGAAFSHSIGLEEEEF